MCPDIVTGHMICNFLFLLTLLLSETVPLCDGRRKPEKKLPAPVSATVCGRINNGTWEDVLQEEGCPFPRHDTSGKTFPPLFSSLSCEIQYEYHPGEGVMSFLPGH